MKAVDEEYFFIRKSDDDRLPLLEPDSNTEDRRFRFEPQPMGSPPLVFNNAWKDHNKKNKIIGITPDILFAGADLVVRTPIRDQLLTYSVPSLYMHPTIYIDNQGYGMRIFGILLSLIALIAGAERPRSTMKKDLRFGWVGLSCMRFSHIVLTKICLIKKSLILSFYLRWAEI